MVKNMPANARDIVLIPSLRRSLGGGLMLFIHSVLGAWPRDLWVSRWTDTPFGEGYHLQPSRLSGGGKDSRLVWKR